MSKEIVIFAKESDERIDALLAKCLDGVSRSAAQRLIEQGHVTFSGEKIKKNRRTLAGDVYTLVMPKSEQVALVAQDIPLDVVYEDEDLIVINKPRGMVVHPAPGHPDGTLVNALMHHCGDSLSGIGGEGRLGIVHRIDKDTSGLIIAAKNDFTHLSLSAQLTDRSLSRVYEAIVVGRLRGDFGTVDAPIGRHHSDRKRMTVTENNSRKAVTHWELIDRYNGYTHVRCNIETGRTHQIRVHMAYIGHPVLGDLVYGRTKKAEKGVEGQCLHAHELKFIHPRTGKQIILTCKLPEYFCSALKRLGPEIG